MTEKYTDNNAGQNTAHHAEAAHQASHHAYAAPHTHEAPSYAPPHHTASGHPYHPHPVPPPYAPQHPHMAMPPHSHAHLGAAYYPPPPYAHYPPPPYHAGYAPPLYPPHAAAYPPGATAAPPPHAAAPGAKDWINDFSQGGNVLSGLGKMLNMDDSEFWKGALIGAGAVLLLTNESVQDMLFSTGAKAKDAVKKGVENMHDVASGQTDNNH